MRWYEIDGLKVLDHFDWGKMLNSGAWWGALTLRPCINPSGQVGLALVHSRDKSEVVVAVWWNRDDPLWIPCNDDGSPLALEDMGLDKGDVNCLRRHIEKAF